MPALILTLAVFAYLSAALLMFGARKPAYSHRRHTISELGESGAPQAGLVAAGVFLPIGLGMLLAAWLARPLGSGISALALCIAAGHLTAAAFPCDPGSPLSGSWRQAVHNLGGTVQYIGGAFVLLQMAGHAGQPFRAFGLFVIGAAIALSVPLLANVRGLVQRVAEGCLFGGLALAAWRAWRAVGQA
jgi:hypothetical protein